MRKRSENHSRWIRNFRLSATQTRHVICFPHAGGAASFFHRWALHLPADASLSAVQYPGREDRLAEEFVTDMQALVEQAAEAVSPLCDADTVLFGHSMGAVVAYEVALQLRASDVPLCRLAVSAHPPPHRSKPKPAPFTEEEILGEVQTSLGQATLPFDRETFREIFLPSWGRNKIGSWRHAKIEQTVNLRREPA